MLYYAPTCAVVKGSYRGTFATGGEGPGEVRNVAGITVLRDGRIAVHDFGNGRYNVHAPDGRLDATWPTRPSIAELRPLYPLPDGGVLLHDLRFAGGAATREQVLVRLDAAGALGDTTLLSLPVRSPPSLALRTETMSAGQTVPFSPVVGWGVTPGGDVVAMDGARHAADVHRTDGSVLRIARAAEPVPVSPAERAAEEARVTAFFRGMAPEWRWDGPAIPDTKPPVDWIHTGRDSPIWLRVAQPGTALAEAERETSPRRFVHEPQVFDVFEADGRFLGQVHAPDGFQVQPHPVLERERVWGVVVGQQGVNYVVRFRVESVG